MSYIEDTNIDIPFSAQLKTQLDTKLSNYYPNWDDYTMIVEDIAGYLGRVKSGIRPVGTPITMLIPKEGSGITCTVVYNYKAFDAATDNYDIKLYQFVGGLGDENFKELPLGDKNYRFTQDMPAKIWYVSHNLNKNPSVTITDTAGSVFVGYIDYTDKNNLVITLNAETSGIAEMN